MTFTHASIRHWQYVCTQVSVTYWTKQLSWCKAHWQDNYYRIILSGSVYMYKITMWNTNSIDCSHLLFTWKSNKHESLLWKCNQKCIVSKTSCFWARINHESSVFQLQLDFLQCGELDTCIIWTVFWATSMPKIWRFLHLLSGLRAIYNCCHTSMPLCTKGVAIRGWKS